MKCLEQNSSYWPRHESVTETRENIFCFDRTLKTRFLVQPLLQTRSLNGEFHPPVEELKLHHCLFRTCFRMWVGKFVQFNLLLICQTALGDERHGYGVRFAQTMRQDDAFVCSSEFLKNLLWPRKIKKKYFAFHVKILSFEKYFIGWKTNTFDV